MRLNFAVHVFLITQALAGCTAADRLPTAPSPADSTSTTPQPTQPARLIAFTDASGFSTTDLRDAQDQVAQFNTAGELIWTADGTRHPGFGVSGSYISAEHVCACWLEVRFGSKDGERRAYLTADYGHENPGSVVDIEIVARAVVVSRTNIFPPGTFTLSGVVGETSPGGWVPLAGARVQRGYATGWLNAWTDSNGFYEIHGLYEHSDDVVVTKDGYLTDRRSLAIDADTRLDIVLVRR